MPMFDNADVEYVRWLETHPQGYVLNTSRSPRPDYLILHRASCKSVSRAAEPPVRWTTGDYIKVCAGNPAEIEHWCRQERGASPQPCGQCHPFNNT